MSIGNFIQKIINYTIAATLLLIHLAILIRIVISAVLASVYLVVFPLFTGSFNGLFVQGTLHLGYLLCTLAFLGILGEPIANFLSDADRELCDNEISNAMDDIKRFKFISFISQWIDENLHKTPKQPQLTTSEELQQLLDNTALKASKGIAQGPDDSVEMFQDLLEDIHKIKKLTK